MDSFTLQVIVALFGALTLVNTFWANRKQQEFNQLAECHKEMEALKKTVKKTNQAIELFITEGIDAAMLFANTRN